MPPRAGKHEMSHPYSCLKLWNGAMVVVIGLLVYLATNQSGVPKTCFPADGKAAIFRDELTECKLRMSVIVLGGQWYTVKVTFLTNPLTRGKERSIPWHQREYISGMAAAPPVSDCWRCVRCVDLLRLLKGKGEPCLVLFDH